MTRYNKRNDYGRDLEVQKNTMFCGIPFVVNLQDRAMTELMCNDKGEPIYDRTQEHLTSSDAMIIAVRKQLLDAVTNLRDAGKVPPNGQGARGDPAAADRRRLEDGERGGAAGRPRQAERRRPADDPVTRSPNIMSVGSGLEANRVSAPSPRKRGEGDNWCRSSWSPRGTGS
jgi:hypothetical protein